MDDEFAAKYHDVLLGDKNDEENRRLWEEMLEELKAKMEQHREENLMKNQEFMQELNLKRFEFDKAEEKITL